MIKERVRMQLVAFARGNLLNSGGRWKQSTTLNLTGDGVVLGAPSLPPTGFYAFCPEGSNQCSALDPLVRKENMHSCVIGLGVYWFVFICV